jgi:hypothetical protein
MSDHGERGHAHDPGEPVHVVRSTTSLDLRSQAHAQARATFWFFLSALSSIALAIVYWVGGQTQAEGALLAVTCGGIGFGIVTWAKHAMPDDEVTEVRESVESPMSRRSPMRCASAASGSVADACCSCRWDQRWRRSARHCCFRSARSVPDRERV